MAADILKLLADPTRLRIVMVLSKKELCVCQIMGVLEVSQSLVSKNLRLLDAAGFLRERKEGKLVFYSLRGDLPVLHRRLIAVLTESLAKNRVLTGDLQSLRDCEEFQKRTGKCDMKTFGEFMRRNKQRKTA